MRKQFIPITAKSHTELRFDEAGDYLVFFHNVTGRLRFDINTRNVRLHIFGLYTGMGKDRFDLSTVQVHNAPSSFSNLYVKGVFTDKARFIYEGLIRIEKDGDGSHAYQKNQNLILSKDVFVSSKPDLEILAQDVFCTHGSTTGRPNQKIKYYLQSRGLNAEEYERVYVAGFIRHLFMEAAKLGFDEEMRGYKQSILKVYA